MTADFKLFSLKRHLHEQSLSLIVFGYTMGWRRHHHHHHHHQITKLSHSINDGMATCPLQQLCKQKSSTGITTCKTGTAGNVYWACSRHNDKTKADTPHVSTSLL
jgi:hypothetical protein